MLIPILLLALQALTPLPQKAKPSPQPIHTPKWNEHMASLGARMARAALNPAATPSGFLITNLSLVNGAVTVQWSQGQPLFQVQGSTLNGSWVNLGNLTTARTATIPISPQHFFRIVQNNSLPLTVNSNTQPRIQWDAPTLDMSDSLGVFHLDRGTDGTNFVADAVTGSPFASNVRQADDATAPAPSLYYKLRQTTANGVVVPYNIGTLSNVAAGTANWAQYITGSVAGAKALAVSPLNGDNVFVGVWITTATAGVDFGDGTVFGPIVERQNGFVVCRSVSGALKWKKLFSSTIVGAAAYATGCQCDSAGNFIVTGGFNGTIDLSNGENPSVGTITSPGGTDINIFLAKYSPTGTILWAKQFGNTSGSIDEGLHIQIDGSDNIFLAGDTASPSIDFGNGKVITQPVGFYSMFIAKFTPGSAGTPGICLWANIHYGNSDNTLPMDIALDSTGNIYVVGTWANDVDLGGGTVTNGSTYRCGFVAKYSGSTGAYSWSHTFATSRGAFNSDLYGNGFAGGTSCGIGINPLNNQVVITGSFTSTNNTDTINFGGGAPDLLGQVANGGGQNFVMVCYDSSGNFVWQLKRGGHTGSAAWGSAVAFDSASKLYVTGYFDDYLDLDLDGLADTAGGGYFISCWNAAVNPPTVQWVQANRGGQSTGQGVCVRIRGTTVTTVGTWRSYFQAGTLPRVVAPATGNAFIVQYTR